MCRRSVTRLESRMCGCVDVYRYVVSQCATPSESSSLPRTLGRLARVRAPAPVVLVRDEHLLGRALELDVQALARVAAVDHPLVRHVHLAAIELLLVPHRDARARHLGARFALEVKVGALALGAARLGHAPRPHRLDRPPALAGRHLDLEIDLEVRSEVVHRRRHGLKVFLHVALPQWDGGRGHLGLALALGSGWRRHGLAARIPHLARHGSQLRRLHLSVPPLPVDHVLHQLVLHVALLAVVLVLRLALRLLKGGLHNGEPKVA
mmetsp:Transcript_12147/g.38371  ORF Transcript_12147/g.38371 Transcript_12147/m.38371 type:complete len:265 (+) Transcript_12147:227-1021(+)